MKYKAGDRVKIKSLDWYNENKNNRNEITFENNPHWRFVANQSDYCGQIATITSVSKTAYRLEHIPWNWTDEMIEGLVEEDKVILDGMSALAAIKNGIMKAPPHSMNVWTLPDGYEFRDENGNVINTQKIVMEKKKQKYPQSYEECCKVLMGKTDFQDFELVLTKLTTNRSEENSISPEPPHISLINAFYKLLICRDAYWKIAGEELGLGKPWKPDWNDLNLKFVIIVSGNEIKLIWEQSYQRTFAFPTAEMRDAFKKNFDPDIEICKELL